MNTKKGVHAFDTDSIESQRTSDDEFGTSEIEHALDAGIKISIARTRSFVERCRLETKDDGLTQSIVKKAMQGVLSGQEKTGENKMNTSANGTARTDKSPSPKSEQGAISSTPLKSLDQPSASFVPEGLDSLSLIDSSMKGLHECLQKLVAETQVNPERHTTHIDTFRVHAAVKCADTIGKLAKIKLDAWKSFKDHAK